MRPTPRCHPPRAQLLDDVQDTQIAVEEERVDGEAHERRVDPGCRRQQQPLASWQPTTADKTAQAKQWVVCQLAYAQAVVAREVHYELGLGHELRSVPSLRFDRQTRDGDGL